MRSHRAVRGPLLLALSLAAVTFTLAGCGGGGGGGLTVAGTVIDYSQSKASRESGTTLGGATVTAYYWTDLTTPIGHATADSNGLYNLSLPSDAATKAIVLVATKGTLRASRVIGDLSAFGRTNANIDNYTTVATEYLLTQVASGSAISGPSVETIMSEVRNISAAGSVSLVAGGTDLPTALGGGLKSTSLNATLASDPTLSAAVTQIAGDPQIQEAKRFAEMTREALWALGVNSQATATSMVQGLQDQWAGMQAGTQGLTDLGYRIKVVFQALWSNDSMSDELQGMASGKYDYSLDNSGAYKLTYTGAAPDGKSWIVTSKLTDSTAGDVLSITPATAIPTFKIEKAAGSYTFSVTNPSDAALDWTGTLAGTQDGNGNVTSVSLNMTANDPVLTKQFKFNGTITVTPSSASTPDHEYITAVHASGSLSSQFVTGSLGDFTVQWQPNSDSQTADLKLIQTTNFTFTTGFKPSLTVTENEGSITFDPADPANGLKYATPNAITLSGSIAGAKISSSLTNAKITFARDYHANASGGLYFAIQPKTITGSSTFTSPSLSLSGSVNGTFNYVPSPFKPEDILSLALSGSLPSSLSGPWPVSKFPDFSVNFKENITPTVGRAGGLDITLASSPTAGAGSTPQVSLTFNKFWYGSETMTGAFTATFGASGGNVVWASPTISGIFTRSPSGYYLNMSGTSLANATGGIYTDSSKTSQLAWIGAASNPTIGLSQLGNVLVVKYKDNSFETFASLLPTLP